MEPLLMGVDIGTTNIKALAVTLRGDTAALASEAIDTAYPAKDRIEQDPEQIWEKYCAAVRRAADSAGAERIAGLCTDSNRCGLILADEEYRPLTRNMTWQDFRCTSQVERFAARHPEIDVYRITGEDALPQHTAFKILWCKEEIPELWEKCRHIFFSPADYISFKLLGRHIASKSIAQSTGLLDINTLCYSETMLRAVGVSREMLPELCDSTQIIGKLGEDRAAALGLCPGLPVVGGVCDATASQIGSGAVEEGLFTVSIGTCSAVRTYCREPIYAQDKFSQIRVIAPFGYVPSCTVTDAGSVLKWFQSNFCADLLRSAAETGADVYEYIDREAEKVAPGAEGLILLPYFTGASYAVKDATTFGVFAGIRNYHTRAHFARSIMEGVAFSLRAVLDSFRENGFAIQKARFVGGGTKSKLWSQILADVLGVEAQIPNCGEAAALGSAVIASVGLKYNETLSEAVEKMVSFSAGYVPQPQTKRIYDNTYTLYRELFAQMKGFYKRHAELTATEKPDR
ncbi:MAG: FGGY family carbohydrate kinase [Oscillospiraceae bacterium]|nr:FGGY family carbohydrate kinase [Oscillospiraceae bacterium]